MSAFTEGNRITLLRNGAAYFPALQQAIDHARHEVHLQTYIFEDDRTGALIADALKRAACRGVEVCLLLDGFGSRNLPRYFVQAMQAAGVMVMLYRPAISPWTLRRRRLRRLHRKIAVIDGALAFVGGINIIDDHNTPDHTPPRMDYAVMVEGPLTAHIHLSARQLWRRLAWARLSVSRPLHHFPPSQPVGTMRAAYVVRDNVLHRRDIENAYLHAIETAQYEIVIANAYFLPGRRFRTALIRAARRGVRVVLLLQGHVEYLLLDYATRATYGVLLEAGVEIHEYHKSMMHSKVAVIDSTWATVGSSNIDPISLMLAREANVMIEDSPFAAALRHDLAQAIQQGAQQVSSASWHNAGILKRVLAYFFLALIRLMILVGGPRH